MPYKVKRLHNEPIVVVTWDSPYIAAEIEKVCDDTDACIRPDETRVWVIEDFRQFKVDFSGIVMAMAIQRRKRPGAAGDPRLRTLLIGSGMLFELVSKGAKQLQYGGIEAPLYSTLDEALAAARAEIKKAAVHRMEFP